MNSIIRFLSFKGHKMFYFCCMKKINFLMLWYAWFPVIVIHFTFEQKFWCDIRVQLTESSCLNWTPLFIYWSTQVKILVIENMVVCFASLLIMCSIVCNSCIRRQELHWLGCQIKCEQLIYFHFLATAGLLCFAFEW